MQSVKAWEEKVIIPTYRIGEPDRNPMFLEKRVYQGSSGAVYPHAVIDKVYDEKEDKEYIALFLENEYLKIMILPEIGGRIQMAYDKTNDYHFIYYNRVIKPALVGLTGPWISGGIEFNWPQHHRPSTFEPVDYAIEDNEDGSKTIWVHEMEIMFHTKGAAGFTLYPDSAYLEVTGRLYNRTPFPQTFLWWANPAVHVDEHYQSVFPPDVHAVYDHGRRDVSSFPIATGTYYKVDYSPGTDISRYQNIPVPTSYMAVNSDFDFVGGYHHQKKAGLLHVADHHISPGKKQWTWGSGEFGKMWDKQLTDEDGPYFEIMTGVYTDNQPDFSWIMPNEERIFRQYFMPYKETGYVKNASKDAAVNLEVTDGGIMVKVYVTSVQKNLHISLKHDHDILLDERTDLSPVHTFSKEVLLTQSIDEQKLWLEVTGEDGRCLISYCPVKRKEKDVPLPAKAITHPKEIRSNEELYLAGLHLEQYRHATYSPTDYYEEALYRDPSDIRCNNALGLWYLKHGQFAKAEPYFHSAVEKITRHNPNPYNGEPYYNLGLCLTYLEKWNEAYDAFYKACWNAAWQDNAYLQLAYMDCRKRNFDKALDHTAHSLARNYHGTKARHLKAILLRKSGRPEEAIKWIKETLSMDKFDFGTRNELYLALISRGEKENAGQVKKELFKLTRGWEQSYIEIAIDYASAGCYEEAVDWLMNIEESRYPMVHYYMAYFFSKTNKGEGKRNALLKAFQLPEDRVFPNRLEDILMLQFAIKENPHDYKAHYYLGNLWYDKRQYTEARVCWEKSAALCESFPTAHRNLGIAYYNKFNLPEKALQEYEKAFDRDTADARILFELDQLYKRMNKPVKERLDLLQKHFSLVDQRDDLYIEYVTLHNLLGLHQEASQLLAQRHFHPWEGGEGKVSGQYIYTKTALAQKALQDQEYDHAIRLLTEAQHYPDNLGEGKLYGAQENNIFYWRGCAYEAKGEKPKAKSNWQLASQGLGEPTQAIYYNDQDPAMIFYQGLALRKLGNEKEAQQQFENLIRYGETHANDKIIIDFFAVSLPELSVFDIDLDKRNRIHCHYLMGLGHLGLGEKGKAAEHFLKVLEMDASHQDVTMHLKWL
jgi:tetratricopeptide (TPR) repeat protein